MRRGRAAGLWAVVFVLFALACAPSAWGRSRSAARGAEPTAPPARPVMPRAATTPAPARPGGASPTTPKSGRVYVTVALHIENARAFTQCPRYQEYRAKLLQFAEALAPYAVAVNLQVDYEFLVGVQRCETPALQARTEGLNVLAYLVQRYGYEIDPHQQGGWDIEGPDNYADIRYLAGQLTPVSETMGGLVWDDPDQWAALAQGQPGRLHPAFVWHPQVLTLAVSSAHHRGDFSADDFASGVWRPQGPGAAFWTHDPQGPWVYIGPGEYDNWGQKWGRRTTPEFVRHLLAQMDAGALDPAGMYTATLAVPQHIVFDPQRYDKLQGLLDELAPLAAAGRVAYASYSQIASLWATAYHERPTVYRAP